MPSAGDVSLDVSFHENSTRGKGGRRSFGNNSFASLGNKSLSYLDAYPKSRSELTQSRRSSLSNAPKSRSEFAQNRRSSLSNDRHSITSTNDRNSITSTSDRNSIASTHDRNSIAAHDRDTIASTHDRYSIASVTEQDDAVPDEPDEISRRSADFRMSRDEMSKDLDELKSSSHHRREDMLKGYSMFNASRVYDDSLLLRKTSAELGFDLMAIPTTSDSSASPKGDLDMDCHADKTPAGSSMLRQMNNKQEVYRRANGQNGKVMLVESDSPPMTKPPSRTMSAPIANFRTMSPKNGSKPSTMNTSSNANNSSVNAKQSESTQSTNNATRTNLIDSDDDSDDSESVFDSDEDSFCVADDNELASKAYIVQDLGASFYFNDEEFFNHHVKPHLVEDDDAGWIDEVIEEQVIVETILPPASLSMKSLFAGTTSNPSSNVEQNQNEAKPAISTDDDSDCDSFCDATGQDVADLRYLEKDLGASCFWGEECPKYGKKKKKTSVMDEPDDNQIMTIGEDDEEEHDDDVEIDDIETEDIGSVSEEELPVDVSTSSNVEVSHQLISEGPPRERKAPPSRSKSQPLNRGTSLRTSNVRETVERTKSVQSTRSFFRSSSSNVSNSAPSSPVDAPRRASGRLRKLFGMRPKSPKSLRD